MSFAELLRIAPVKLQFKSNANRADISKFLEHTAEELRQEENPACVEMDKDYIQHMDLCQYFGHKKLKVYADFFNSSSSFCWGVI